MNDFTVYGSSFDVCLDSLEKVLNICTKTPIVSYPTGSSSRHLKIPFCPCLSIPRKPLPYQNEGDLIWILENKANNNALGQTPTLLHERAESILGFTKGYHL